MSNRSIVFLGSSRLADFTGHITRREVRDRLAQAGHQFGDDLPVRLALPARLDGLLELLHPALNVGERAVFLDKRAGRQERRRPVSPSRSGTGPGRSGTALFPAPAGPAAWSGKAVIRSLPMTYSVLICAADAAFQNAARVQARLGGQRAAPERLELRRRAVADRLPARAGGPAERPSGSRPRSCCPAAARSASRRTPRRPLAGTRCRRQAARTRPERPFPARPRSLRRLRRNGHRHCGSTSRRPWRWPCRSAATERAGRRLPAFRSATICLASPTSAMLVCIGMIGNGNIRWSKLFVPSAPRNRRWNRYKSSLDARVEPMPATLFGSAAAASFSAFAADASASSQVTRRSCEA